MLLELIGDLMVEASACRTLEFMLFSNYITYIIAAQVNLQMIEVFSFSNI